MMKVLVADDDATSREMLDAALRRWGYNVVFACDGTEAWKALQSEDAPELVILDWMMPGMDGVEVCRNARTLDARNPPYLLLLTTRNRTEDLVAGLLSGADDYVLKPFDSEELRARLHVGQRIVELRNALAKQIQDLEAALTHIRTLQGILPICMHCHKIRDDQESWQRLENYIQAHTEVHFSHGVCPECLEKLYPKPTRLMNPETAG